MYKKYFKFNRPKVSQKKKDANIYMQSQGRWKTQKEFVQYLNNRKEK
tara:strand:- start:91 stop:231 length:141 start_codon:yes stop_codon:yes gene_type:complete